MIKDEQIILKNEMEKAQRSQNQLLNFDEMNRMKITPATLRNAL